jgi:protein tyrosine/serine phosphatase
MKRARETQGRSLFVHCTVGEDRTGYIAALYKIAFKGLDTKTAFRDEMCARGYAEGDPEKPAKVSQIVHETLTPLFLKMSDLARRHPEAFRKLDTRLCQADPWLAANAKHVPSFEDQKEQFRCANPPAR